MRERVLFVPIWTISAECCETIAGIRALLDDLRARFEVEVFQSPARRERLASEPTMEAALGVFERALPENGHVLTMGGSTALVLAALGRTARSVRSLSAAGMWVPGATLRALGRADIADVAVGTPNFNSSYQYFRLVMEGASDEQIDAAARQANADIDGAFAADLSTPLSALNLTREPPVRVPTLYLDSPLPVAGFAEMTDLFVSLVPHAEVQPLERWPGRLHERATGRDVSEKVIPFIRKHAGRLNGDPPVAS
jgi:hypothetical protein